MSMTYSVLAAEARLTAALNATGTAPGASVNGQVAGGGLLVIGTSALSGSTGVLCTIVLPSSPPFTIAGKTATIAGVPLSGFPSANGTAALAEFQDSAGNTVASGLTVDVADADIIVGTTSLVTSVAVAVNSGTITTQ